MWNVDARIERGLIPHFKFNIYHSLGGGKPGKDPSPF